MTNKFEVAIVARDEFTKPLTAFTKRTREAFGEAGKSARTTGKAWRQVGQDIEDAVEVSRPQPRGGDSLKGRPGSGAVPKFLSGVPQALAEGAGAAGLLGKGGASGLLGALAAGSLLGAGVAAAGTVANNVDQNVAMARSLRMYGLNPHVSQQWLGAADLANYSREGMMGTLTSLARTMYGVQNRPNEYVRQRMVLQKLGIDESSSPERVMSRLSDLLPDLNTGMRRTIGSELGINDDTLDFLSRGRGFVLDHLTKAKTEPGLILSNEQLQRAEEAGRLKSGVATTIDGYISKGTDSLIRAVKEFKEAVTPEESAAPPASPASHAEDVESATRALDIYFHGLPHGVTATAKPRGDTSRARIATNRASGAP